MRTEEAAETRHRRRRQTPRILDLACFVTILLWPARISTNMRCFLHRVTAEDSHSLQDPCRMHVEKAIDCKERTPVRESLPSAALRQRSAAVPDLHSVTPTARTFLIFEPPMPCVPCTSGSALSPFPSRQVTPAYNRFLRSACLIVPVPSYAFSYCSTKYEERCSAASKRTAERCRGGPGS